MSKKYIKYVIIVIGFTLASIGNGCMGGLGESSKNLSSGNEDRKENSGVGSWSTYPGGTTNNTGGTTAGETGGATGSSTGTTSGTTAGTTGGTSGGHSGGSSGVTGGSGSCSTADVAVTPGSGSGSPASCESADGEWDKLEQWLENSRSQGIPYCGIFKACKNCCGSELRYDMFYGKCACPMTMDASTLGANSNSECEDTGMDYLAGFMEAKARAGIPCTTVKDCANCCGPADNLDKFHVSCQR